MPKYLPFFLLLVFLTSCSQPGNPAQPTLSVEQQAATIVALTLGPGGPSASTNVASTPLASPPPATPTVKPIVFIHTDNANCRTGPGPDYKVITTFPNGTTVELVQKDTTDSYWIVRDPSSQSLCWVQAQDATPGGSFESVPEVTPQVVSHGAPAQPTVFYPNFFCDATSLTVTLTWNDVATDENGYRVYRGDTQVADLPANSTTYKEKIDFNFGSQVTYSIEAYNDAGTSPRKSITFKCPP